MADKSGIPYVGASWSLVVGCTKCSPGCANCWAIRDARRMGGHPNSKVSDVYKGLTCRTVAEEPPTWTGEVRPIEDRLTWPAKWSKPKRILVSSHGDLFHTDVSDAFIFQALNVMALHHWHTFIVLTKRAARMKAACAEWINRCYTYGQPPYEITGGMLPDNIIPSITAENQDYFQRRISYLLDIPAKHHAVSLEPLLGPIDMGVQAKRLSWVIAGCESGPRRRIAVPDWFRVLRDQCHAANVPYYLKQMQDDYGHVVKLPYLHGKQYTMLPGDSWS